MADLDPNTAPEAFEGRLADNIVHFARALRTAGMRVGPGAVVDAIRAVEAAGIGEKQDFYWVLHSVLVNRREDHELFDQAFRLYWRKRALLERMMAQLLPPSPGAPKKDENEVRSRVADALMKNEQPPEKQKPKLEIDARLTLSDQEVLQAKDFEQMSAAEIAEARRLIGRMLLPLNKVRTRRLEPSSRGRTIDLRRSFRSTIRSGGGGVIDLRKLAPAERHPPLVAICDISGSMTQYSRMFLHFLHALTEARGRVSSFVFGTRLTNITRQIKARDPDEALERCSDAVADWAGGTRISDCLHEFNRKWSRRVLAQGAVVLLVTDGLERGGQGELAFEMDRLHRSCRRLIWLNPLLRYDRFEAKAAGIVTMLPHVDEFRTIHSLDAMADLIEALDTRRRGDADPAKWLKARAA
ncbi:VWA domain-containing protein [Microbaculum marinum]|uniref:VWA domain-containing protein n=1 Tax=Microbaculum marinum TaxID=1764581 RepID=A0AAW9RQG8_9HYPH